MSANGKPSEVARSAIKAKLQAERIEANRACESVIDPIAALRQSLSGGNHGTVVVSASGQGVKRQEQPKAKAPDDFKIEPQEFAAERRFREGRELEARLEYEAQLKREARRG